MLFLKEVKKQIKQIIKNPPSHAEMMLDLTMYNVSVRQKSGDIGLLRAMDKNLLERVWKSYKIKSILKSNIYKLEKAGIRTHELYEEFAAFIEDLEDEADKSAQSQVEGLLKEGVLELEVFKSGKKIIN